MTKPQTAPFGSWRSPITPDLILASSLGLSEPRFDGEDVYWIEGRPAERGRQVLMRRAPDGTIAEAVPAEVNARTRVHEYGGGSTLVAGGVAYFSNFADQRLYRRAVDAGEGALAPLTPESGLRYADAVLDAARGRLIVVREDHRDASHEAVNTITAVRTDGSSTGDGGTVLVSGGDFYSSPRLSPNGNQLAWLTWNHPNMPWDGTELWMATVAADGSLGEAQLVAGGNSESIFQPEWSPDGVLYFISDRTGWWNLYRRTAKGETEAVTAREAEFGLPQWVFGLSTYAFESPERIVCRFTRPGGSRLALLDTRTKRIDEIEVPYTSIAYMRAVPGKVTFLGGSPTQVSVVVLLDLATRKTEVLRRSSDLVIDEAYLSVPQAVEFPTEGGLTAHGYFYPPKNTDFAGLPGEKPPLLVKSHGGPTSATSNVLDAKNQYWTSRGIAVLDVNYGGSTGYGRAYRERLNGTWGVVDVDDCANGALWLAEQGLVDGKRLAITGGSAGGYTTLCALTFRDTFAAGASHYGVSDLEALAKETHKFESRYLDGLIGPYPARLDLYHARSPVHHAARLSCPVIFFQGLDDPIVPPNQAEMMVEALEAKQVPVAYVSFEGEQHGFRRSENIKRSLEGELYFYSRVFGFKTAGEIEPVPIFAEDHLPSTLN